MNVIRVTSLLSNGASSEPATPTITARVPNAHRPEGPLSQALPFPTPSSYNRSPMKIGAQIEDRILAGPLPEGFPRTVVLPDYEGFAITAVPSFIELVFGLAEGGGPLYEAIDPGRFNRVILLILDGLGYRKLLDLSADGGVIALKELGERGAFIPITSVFPATTAAALTAYSTGLPPAAHGIIGYRLYLRETGAITNMIRLSLVGTGNDGTAIAAGLDPDKLLRGPTLYERLSSRSVATHTLLPHQIAKSGLSKLLYRGSTSIHPTVSFPDMLVTARRILARAEGPTFLTLYWPSLDGVAHVRGPGSDAYLAEALSIDSAIRRELVGRVKRTLIIVSSDHGFVPMERSDYLPLSSLPGLDGAVLLPPVGEPRASYLYLRNGSRDRLSREAPLLLEGGLLALTADQVIEGGLLGRGRIHPELKNRLGDLIIVSTGKAGLHHPYPDARFLRGMHGGLTAEEMIVPLIVSTL